MYTIQKYGIKPDFVDQVITMPTGASILSFGLDEEGHLSLWAMVDTLAPIEEHVFACVETGWPIEHIFSENVQYTGFVGTVTQGRHVWHLFDLGAALDQEHWELVTKESIEEAQAHENIN